MSIHRCWWRHVGLNVPLTVHVAIGTDIVHMTPALDGAALGKAALDDFRSLCGLVARMIRGRLAQHRQRGRDARGVLEGGLDRAQPRAFAGRLTTANLDFDQKYRGLLNVLERPGAQGIALTGHHEILIPLLHAAVLSRIAQTEDEGTTGLILPRSPSGEAR